MTVSAKLALALCELAILLALFGPAAVAVVLFVARGVASEREYHRVRAERRKEREREL